MSEGKGAGKGHGGGVGHEHEHDDGHVHGPHCNHGPPSPVRKEARPGRNEPCWCGSGKKYKKCHLPLDGIARA